MFVVGSRKQTVVIQSVSVRVLFDQHPQIALGSRVELGRCPNVPFQSALHQTQLRWMIDAPKPGEESHSGYDEQGEFVIPFRRSPCFFLLQPFEFMF